ncbi:MAG: UDP-glucose 4-epimerase GalE [Ignavibacteriaceae bacterium]|nr:UDP-glucose 4-epimerase GalE [Ignavibacteriaceae bacterium]
MQKSSILVTGGAGYIGSHLVHDLTELGYKVTVLDNLSTGFLENIPAGVELIEADLKSPDLKDILRGREFDTLFHFASKKAAGESMEIPEVYMLENITGALNLFSLLKDLKIRKVIFSSTAAVYGAPESIPVAESAPKNPINYYGFTKLSLEQNLSWLSQIRGIHVAVLRYFNAAGYDVKGRVTKREVGTANLLPVVLETLAGIRSKLMVFGDDYNTPDGSCIRDYIHPSDLSSAHILAMDYLEKNRVNLTLNLGTGKGYSVFEVIKAAADISGLPLNYEVTSRREGDPAALIADASEANHLLGWTPRHSDIETIISTMLPLYISS